MKCAILFLLLAVFFTEVKGQLQYDFTTATTRSLHDKQLRDNLIKGSLAYPLTDSTEGEWRKAFWAMELMLYKMPAAKAKLQNAWQGITTRSEGFQKALLEVSYTLYPSSFSSEVTGLLSTTPSPSVFIRCAEYLLQSNKKIATRTLIKDQLQKRFDTTGFTGISLLQKRLKESENGKRPPLEALFCKSFLPGKTVIYSLQRNNRNYPGLVLIRRGDGTFVYNTDGSIFHTSQLARSITGYPYYITNGNTPQGIYRWTGFDSSTISYIGPTRNLQLVMPYEAAPAVFFADSTLGSAAWQLKMYKSLLPASWKGYEPIYQSWWAGVIGRSEVIMHGTTINPKYYKGEPYYPQTPSLGCLCSYEEWDSKGRRSISNQQKIVDALTCIGSKSGYVIVVDLDNRHKEVSLTEVKPFLHTKKK